MGRSTKDYMKQGANEQVIASGGILRMQGLMPVAQDTPAAKTVAVTLTIAELLIKILTGTHAAGATAAYTLPTGALIDAGVDLEVEDSIDWALINLSAAAVDTITITAATGHTLIGNGIVQSAHSSTGELYGNSAQFRTVKTAADTMVTYRIG